MKDHAAYYGRGLERRVLKIIQACGEPMTVNAVAEQIHREAPYLDLYQLRRRIWTCVRSLHDIGELLLDYETTANKTRRLLITCPFSDSTSRPSAN